MVLPLTLAVVATLLSPIFFLVTPVASQKDVFAQAELIDGVTQYRPPQGYASQKPFQAVTFPVLKYTVMDGYFKQNDERTDDRTYNPLNDSFGLLLSGSDRWVRFQERIALLNYYAPQNIAYKVLYLARHGQGQHNVAEHHFGPEAWECYWAMQGHNATYTWGPDAKLTPEGITQVHATRDAWRVQLAEGMPLPESHHVSPLSRSLSTLIETWSTIHLGPPRPVVNELLRETLSLHYGDQRAPASVLRERYPEIDFPAHSFPELDPLWNYHRESLQGRNARIKHALDQIMLNDRNTYISMTSHSGVINSTLVALGHRPYNLQTAGMIPVVVKVERDKEMEKGGRIWWQPLTPWTENKGPGLEVEERSVCEGYPSVKVSGRYENGMGVWPFS